jgi:hypothetical protein
VELCRLFTRKSRISIGAPDSLNPKAAAEKPWLVVTETWNSRNDDDVSIPAPATSPSADSSI